MFRFKIICRSGDCTEFAAYPQLLSGYGRALSHSNTGVSTPSSGTFAASLRDRNTHRSASLSLKREDLCWWRVFHPDVPSIASSTKRVLSNWSYFLLLKCIYPASRKIEAVTSHATPVFCHQVFAGFLGIGCCGEEHAFVAGRFLVCTHATGLVLR